MELHITFGWHLDGPSYPEESGLGHLAVGPIGMLGQLCLRLGLTARFPAPAVRIAEYMSLLSKVDDGSQFYSRSFQTDAWGTAKALLFLRDELRGNGWNIHVDKTDFSVPKRLATFAEVEQSALEIRMATASSAQSSASPSGNLLCLTDMIVPILELLQNVDRVPINSITLIDEEALLPPVWQRLFRSLKENGVAIRSPRWMEKSTAAQVSTAPVSAAPASTTSILTAQASTAQASTAQVSADANAIASEIDVSAQTDVAKLGAFLNANQRSELSGDGTLLIVESDDEVQASDCVANLLEAIASENESTVVIRGSSTSFLDQMLKKRNLPALGGAGKSPLRGYMQILPLALELLWKPFDPVKMIEFLLLPSGPVSPSIARTFIYSLRSEPGIGGGEWQKAWHATREKLIGWQRNKLQSEDDNTVVGVAENTCVELAQGNGVDVAQGNSVDVAQGNGVDVAQGNGVDVAQGNSVDVAQGNGVDVAQGNGEDVAAGSDAILVESIYSDSSKDSHENANTLTSVDRRIDTDINSGSGKTCNAAMDAADEAERAALLQEERLRQWLEPVQFDSREGIPSDAVVSLCERVRSHAHMRFNLPNQAITESERQVFLKTAACAETLAASVKASGVDRFTRSQLLRIVESAMGEGYSPDNPQSSAWTPVDHPGQIVDYADTVIWWGFIDTQNHSFTTPWSTEELAYLESQGVRLDSPREAVVREAKSWCRPISTSVKRILFVKPRTVAGRTVAAHPFYHEVAAALEATPHRVRERFIKQAHRIYMQPETDLFRYRLKSEAVDQLDRPGARPIWQVAMKKPLELVTESATSLERLLACPMSWLMQYKAKFRHGSLLSMQSGPQLSGTLAHVVLSRVFQADNLNPEMLDEAETRANRIFDDICPQVAAPFLLPGNSLERQRLKKSIADAASNLAGLIKQAAFERIDCEMDTTATINDVALTGRPDLVLSHPENFQYVIDLKWTRRAASRRLEIIEGRAIQLALYARLLKNESKLPTMGGYYMIAQKQLLSTSTTPFPKHTHVDGPGLDDTFESLIAAYKQHIDILNTGTIYATGLESGSLIAAQTDLTGVEIQFDDEPEEPASKVPGIAMTLEPPCRICNFGRLCGKKGFDQ
jgi:hypothetical protein